MKDFATWYTMYQADFKHKHWAISQVSSVKTCVESFITYSPPNYSNEALGIPSVLAIAMFVSAALMVI